MSRLLFAAARGARIEFYSYQHREWRLGDSLIRMHHGPEDYRIHPEDAHMQYGPISSALREAAFLPLDAIPDVRLPYLIGDFEFEIYEFFAFESVPELRGTFLLILAEALADEGL